MTLSIWRYSHLALAVSSCLFLTLAALTGIILAIEPIDNKLGAHTPVDLKDVSLANTVTRMNTTFDEVFEFSIDENDQLIADLITLEGESGSFILHPYNMKILGQPREKAGIYSFATNLHRSLFLKTTGRIIVGVISLLLCLIAITGFLLLLKRFGGIRKFFSKEKECEFLPRFHVIFGRWGIIPILIIAATGVFLSAEQLSLVSKHYPEHDSSNDNEASTEKISPSEFEVFKNTNLDEVRTVSFPFSSDPGDYYLVSVRDREYRVNQFTGEIISEVEYPLLSWVSGTSMSLHTGRGSIIWSIVLFLTCVAILYFICSGLVIFAKRFRRKKRVIGLDPVLSSEYVILVGSETGNTMVFARRFADALIAAGKSIGITELNHFEYFPKAKEIIIFTSTYGEGEAPSNASGFIDRIHEFEYERPVNFCVVAFGSMAYPDFCRFGIDSDASLGDHPGFRRALPLAKINNQSEEAFRDWVRQWNVYSNMDLELARPTPGKPKKQLQFRVVERSVMNGDQTFLLQLQPEKKLQFASGDLFAFRPSEDQVVRYYSIGKVDGNLTLSIRKHTSGLASTMLSEFTIGDRIRGRIKKNFEFRFPEYATELIMIANGTGIAPFLGMIHENTERKTLKIFWGGRTSASLAPYADIITRGKKTGQLTQFEAAFSREGADRKYVQQLVEVRGPEIVRSLDHGGVVMICGSIAMEQDVIEILDGFSRVELHRPLSEFENLEQIKTDCY